MTSVNLLKNDLGDGAATIVAAAKQQGNIKTLCGIKEGKTKLDLTYQWLKAPDTVPLSFDVEFNRSLTSVNLLKNNLGDGAAEIVAAARRQGNIRTICGIEEGKIEVDFSYKSLEAPDAVLLSFDLEFNRALTSVNLGVNSIGDEGTAALSEALKANSTLETLGLRQNEIGAAGAQSLAGMLQVNRALTSVNLLKNDLGDGAAAVVAAAKQNSNIKTLCGIAEGKAEVNLAGKFLRAPDAVLLSFDLEVNRALKSANLGENEIGDEATAALSEALKSNSTLEELLLFRNKIGAAGAQSLADMLQFNRSLKSANLAENDIGNEGATMILIMDSMILQYVGLTNLRSDD